MTDTSNNQDAPAFGTITLHQVILGLRKLGVSVIPNSADAQPTADAESAAPVLEQLHLANVRTVSVTPRSPWVDTVAHSPTTEASGAPTRPSSPMARPLSVQVPQELVLAELSQALDNVVIGSNGLNIPADHPLAASINRGQAAEVALYSYIERQHAERLRQEAGAALQASAGAAPRAGAGASPHAGTGAAARAGAGAAPQASAGAAALQASAASGAAPHVSAGAISPQASASSTSAPGTTTTSTTNNQEVPSTSASAPSPSTPGVCPTCGAPTAKENWYTVTAGRAVGVFNDTAYAQSLVSGISHSSYKRYSTRAKAEEAFDTALKAGLVVILN